jgi:uncharacterized protein YjbJ (UPF0337 family)
MKTFFYSLLLCTLFISPAWADSHESEMAEEEHGVKVTIDMDEDEPSRKVSEKELENKIKGKVLSIIGDIIDAADDDLSEDEREEIKSEIKEAIQEIKEVTEGIDDDSHSIVIGSDGGGIWDDGISLIEALIPITAIVFTFGMPIMIVAVVLYSSYRKKRLMHDTIDQYVSSGKDIPPEVLKGLQKEVTPKNNLHRGLVMSGVGLGIFACFAVIGTLSAAAFGLIPLFIGLAQLLIWKLEEK